MKNIYVFIFFVSTLGVFFNLPRVTAESALALPFGKLPYTLASSVSFGIFYGQGEEIVYHDIDKDTYWSQLLWDIKPLWYYGYALSYGLEDPLEKAALFAELLLRSGIPADTGVMEDRDWNAPDHGYSQFSTHTNLTQGAILADIGLGLTFPIRKRVLLKTGLWFSWMRFSWDARDGYYQHAEGDRLGSYGSFELWDPSIEKIYVFGPAISYDQEWLILSPGFSLLVPFQRMFSLEFSLLWSPFIKAAGLDTHHGSHDVQYWDSMPSGAMLFEPRGEFTFSPHKKLSLSWYIAYRHISGARGTTVIRTATTSPEQNAGPVSKSDADSGAAWRALETGLSFTIAF
jgi:outer membrane protease